MLLKEPLVRKHSLIKDKKFLMKETFLNSFKRKEKKKTNSNLIGAEEQKEVWYRCEAADNLEKKILHYKISLILSSNLDSHQR